MKKLFITTGFIITTAALAFSASSTTVHAQEDCSGYEGLEQTVCKAEERFGKTVNCDSGTQTIGFVGGDSKTRDFERAICRARDMVEASKREKAPNRQANADRRALAAESYKKKISKRIQSNTAPKSSYWDNRRVYRTGVYSGYSARTTRPRVYGAGMILPSRFDRARPGTTENTGLYSRRERSNARAERAAASSRGIARELRLRIKAFKEANTEGIKQYKRTADGQDIMRFRNKAIACMTTMGEADDTTTTEAIDDAWKCVLKYLPDELR